MFQPQGLNSLLKDGGKHFAGVDEALIKNIEACKELAKMVRTSFGPNGCNKLVINHLNKHFVTSDTATMLREMDVMHPCGKMLVQAATQQEFECGDATNLTVTLAGSLLHEADALLKEGLHAADILKGYEIAMDKCLETLETCESWKLENFKDSAQVKQAVKTAICAKQLELEPVLSKLLAEAVVQVTGNDAENVPKKFELDNIRTCKIPGGQLSKSFVVDGMVIPRPTYGTERKKFGCKVAVYGSGVEFQQTEAKGTVLLNSAEDLMNFSKGEEAQMEEFVKGIKEAGVEVIISGGAISELALHFLDKYKVLVVKIGSKFELRRICKSLKAINIIRAGPPLPEELGYADSVEVQEIASQKITVFKTKESRIATVVIRGATASTLDEWERAINDGVHVIRCAAQDTRFCTGGAATEMKVAHELQKFGQTVPGLEQYAVLKFAEALEIVAKILIDNCGKKSRVEVLTSMYEAANKNSDALSLDVNLDSEGVLCDGKKASIFDHLETKKWAVRHACEAVLTVLRVDHIIMAKQAGGPTAGT